MSTLRITVLIITYKQECVIGRTIESILNQKSKALYEIVIVDDCSPDNNWDVILSYKNKYPTLIRAYRNRTNKGIYGNSESAVALRGDGDLFYMMAGDDMICEGWFDAVLNYVECNKINVRNERVLFFSDWKNVDSNGKEKVYIQSCVENNVPLMSLRLRGLVGGRSMMVSKEVMDLYKPVELNKGLPTAESRFENQPFYYAEKVYYIPYVASIYYSGIGISTKLHTKDYLELTLYNQETLAGQYDLDYKDKQYLKYCASATRFKLSPSITLYFQAFNFYIRSIRPYCKPTLKELILRFVSLLLYPIRNKKSLKKR